MRLSGNVPLSFRLVCFGMVAGDWHRSKTLRALNQSTCIVWAAEELSVFVETSGGARHQFFFGGEGN